MSRSINKVILIGSLGKAPEMRYTPSGRPVTTFVLTTNRDWNTSEGEARSEIEFFNIITWGDLAEKCNQNLNKGSQVYVEGRLQTRRWQDKNGIVHDSVEIVAGEMILLGQQSEAFDDASEQDSNQIIG
jgi:single-strand DNA-binding protein